MAHQRQQRGRGSAGGVLRLVAVLLLLSLCLARADAVAAPSASQAGAAPASEHGVPTAPENALAQEEVARGHSTPSTAAAAAEEEDGGGDVVLERVAMESTEDYGYPSANSRHIPHP